MTKQLSACDHMSYYYFIDAKFFFWLLERFSLECRKLFAFTLVLHSLPSVIGLKISCHFLGQSEVKPKPIVTRLRTLSRASCQLHVFASSFDWFTGLSVPFVIGQSNYFGFGFTTLN